MLTILHQAYLHVSAYQDRNLIEVNIIQHCMEGKKPYETNPHLDLGDGGAWYNFLTTATSGTGDWTEKLVAVAWHDFLGESIGLGPLC